MHNIYINSLLLSGRIFVRTAVVMLFLVVGARLLGKRQIGQMTIYDLAMIMLVANAVQNAMTAGKGNISVGIASASALLIVGIGLTYLVIRSPLLSRVIAGTPTVLVSKGIEQERNMKKEGVTHEILMASIREHQYTSLAEIQLAVLEIDGSISIVGK